MERKRRYTYTYNYAEEEPMPQETIRGRPPDRHAMSWVAAKRSTREYKESREKDFQSWVLAAALVMVVALSGIFSLQGPHDVGWFLQGVQGMAATCLGISGMLALKCINDFSIYHIVSVNTPPDFYMEMNREILYRDTNEDIASQLEQRPFDKVLRRLGVESHHKAFYQSIQFMCAGAVLVCYLKHTPICAILLAIVFIIFTTEFKSTAHDFFAASDDFREKKYRQYLASKRRPRPRKCAFPRSAHSCLRPSGCAAGASSTTARRGR